MLFFLMCELLKTGNFFWDMVILNVEIFSLLMRLIWVQNTLTHENITCWIFISLRSILYSLNWLGLECLHASVYGSHSVEFAYIERDNIFLRVYPQLFFFFLFGLCLFKFSPPPKFSPKLFFPKLVLFFLLL